MPTRTIVPMLVALGLLPGCGRCDDLYDAFLPTDDNIRWVGPQTIELTFAAPLAEPTDAFDLRHFGLMRFNAADEPENSACYAEVYFQPIVGGMLIPESLSWQPDQPNVLLLHYPEPIPLEGCETWGSDRAVVHGFELSYQAGVDELHYATGDEVASWGTQWIGLATDECLLDPMLPACPVDSFTITTDRALAGPDPHWLPCPDS